MTAEQNQQKQALGPCEQRIDESRVGQRLDNVALAVLQGVARPRVYRWIRHKSIRVNGKRSQPDYRVQVGDVIRWPYPPGKGDGQQAEALPPPKPRWLDQVRDAVCHEDEEIIVIDKPAGMPSHSGSGLAYGAIELARLCWPEHDLQVAHRLDRGTSGCLVLCKGLAVQRKWQAYFREHRLRKVYDLVCHHVWRRTAETTCEVPLKRVVSDPDRPGVIVSDDGQAASTRFVLRATNTAKRISFVEAFPLTGRMHQIRVHCQHLGHPILGDARYGAKDTDKPLGRRLALHARRLELLDEKQKRIIWSVEIPSPKEWSTWFPA